MVVTAQFRTGEIDLRRVPAAEREAAWRQAAAPHSSVTGLPPDFLAKGNLLQLGSLKFTDSEHPQQIFTRDASRVRRDSLDNISCSMELSPGSRMLFGDEVYILGVGDVILTDLARPSTKIGATGRTLCLEVERDALLSLLPSRICRGGPLGPMAAIFADHLQLLQQARGLATAESAPHLERATLSMLAACIQPTGAALEQAAPALTSVTVERARRIIDARMHDPDFGPAELATALGFSRTRLYGIFEPHGGIATFIRERRLTKARRLLGALGPEGRVQDVAFAVGFRSDSQFSRAYRRRFDIAPSDSREIPSPRSINRG